MSGGSYDYICYKIKELKSEIRGQESNPRRKAFAELMELVGNAMHDIEWVDSCDYGVGDENESIDKVFSYLSNDPETIIKARSYDEMSKMIQDFLKLNKTNTREK